MLICISIHADTDTLFSSYNTQEGELLRACCLDNCLFGQRETNAAGISSEHTLYSV